MKNLYAAALLLAGHLACAQAPTSTIKAGTVLVGGGINYAHNAEDATGSYVGSSTYTSSYSRNTLSLSPYAGIFVADNVALGLSLNYANGSESYVRTSSPSSTRDSGSQFRIGVFGQQYRMFTEHFGLVGTLSAGYEHDVVPSYNSNTPGEDAKGFYASLTPAILFFPVSKLSVGASVGSIGYTRLSIKPTTGSVSNSYSDIAESVGASFGLDQLTFSGTYYFGR